MHVHLFTTGGTIDKVYFDAKSDYEVGDPQIVEILRQVGAGFSYACDVLMQKDSLNLSDADRTLIAERVLATRAEHVIVTHGTDTMVETAQCIERALGETPDKTVVLVGSLTPARFKSSDAEFNIGFATAAAQTLPKGVFITMNGRVFRPDAVRKNRSANRFETIEADSSTG